MTFWSVVQTHAQRETIAADQLERRGFEIYLPRIKTAGRVAPLFPTYLFVQVCDIWHPILTTVGVMRLLRNGASMPAKIGDDIVAEIRSREKRGVVRLPRAIKPGDRVRITRGTFRDRIAIYDGMGSHERERVLLELLGREVRLELASDDIAPLHLAS